jgi:hypothetical protein
MLRNLILASTAGLTLAVPAASQAWPIVIDLRVPIYRPAPVIVADPVIVTSPEPVVVPVPAPVVVPAPVPVYVLAPPVVIVEPAHRHFHVQYRGTCHQPWHEYAAYHTRGRALDVRDSLARRGFEARVVRY